MHKRFVLNIVSRILMVVCYTMLFPLGWALADDYHGKEASAFIVTILLGIFVSILVRVLLPIKKKDYQRINAKDGLAIVGLSWVFLSLLGALPLYLSQATATYTDAFFEITSGFTTTGSTIFTNIEALPRGILFWRSLTHWLGGMGIIVLYIALLPALGTNAFQLYKAEAPGLSVERVGPRLKDTAKYLWGVYFLLTFVEVVLLYMAGMPLFDSLCHTFGTIATGGFSTKNASMAAYGNTVQWIVLVFMFLAGTNFILHFQALRGNFKAFFRNEEFKVYVIVILLLIPLFSFFLGQEHLSQKPFLDSAFQIVAILTTTGYTTVNFDLWPTLLKFILVVLMIVGGCGGSTGGGMKMIRILLSVKTALRSGMQTVFPNAILPVKFNKRPISEKMIMAVSSYFIIFMFLIVGGSLGFIITEKCDLVTAVTAAISALSNIGPGLEKVGAIKNYAWVSMQGKWLLTFLMLAGRLELYSILILFLPATWKK
ncbi:Trk potassium uptake system protein TrkH [hydrothermal vent metagenome]|uniref:Trk potassium uptake system protein TrkH n=1 Tax=hydrothermal vent metagenome TaxID=652676 RepID=A0A3B0U7H3_9ZZZZ